jgi:hypothetical protein
MNPARRGLLVAALLAVAVVLPACSTTTADPDTDADHPGVNAPAEMDGDADADEDHAVVDPDAKGSAPAAFTVKGHAVHIDARKLKSKAVKKQRAEVEAELTESGRQGTVPEAPVQTNAGTTAAPAPAINVKGLDFATWGAGHPPDTNGAIGPNHFVQSVNTSVGIFDKTNGSRLAAFTFDDFFANSGTAECDANNGGDPTVIYDAPSGKWVIADFAWLDVNKGPFYECVAVSAGADPVNTTWTFYSVPAGDGKFPDYPKFGTGPDGVYFTTNNFRGNSYSGAGVYALKRESLGAATLQGQHVTTSSKFFSLLPANLQEAPQAGAPEYVVSTWSGKLTTWTFKVDWANAANSKFTQVAALGISYSSVGSIPTPGEAVDSLSPRAMNQAQQRGGSIWVSQTVAAGGTAGVRWYEVSNLSAPAIHQQGTYAPADGLYRWMPSLAVDKAGDMAVGYSVGSGSKNPSIRYAGRLASDPLNTLGQAETSLVEGTGAPTTGNYNRWGDYSQMSVDPVDGCTFWYTTEYYEQTGANWQTRIGSFKFPSCV